MTILPNEIDKSWNDFLERKEIKEELNYIDNFLKARIYFPDKENILRFLSINKNNIKVVIVGMEPYPSSYEKDNKTYPIATGRSFEVANVDDWSQKFKQSSLRNILKTIYFNETNEKISLENLRSKIKNKEFEILQPHEWFNDLEEQGVLFLNASLTVQQYKVATHTKLWDRFITYLIKELDKNDVTWLLWGKDAQNRVLPHIEETKAICTCHPRLPEFVQENCFKNITNIKWKGKM